MMYIGKFKYSAILIIEKTGEKIRSSLNPENRSEVVTVLVDKSQYLLRKPLKIMQTPLMSHKKAQF